MSVRACLLALFLFAGAGSDCQPVAAAPASAVPASAVPDDPQDRLNELRQSLTSGELPVRSSYARQQLKQILARREFADTMRDRSPWERWKQQLAVWLQKHLAALFDSIAQHPSTSQAIFWIVAIGSLVFIAIQLFRLFRREDLLDLRLSYPEPVRQNTPAWISAARSLAERGELGRAIQCLYWAAIVHLQSMGSLPKTAGHTPREFLRDLRAASASEYLRSLTLSLERFWFAGRPASADDFAACLRAVEGLGCKLD